MTVEMNTKMIMNYLMPKGRVRRLLITYLTLNIMEIKKFKPTDHYIKALIYGPSKAGKTKFCGTANNAIFASAEGGLLSIAEKNPDFVSVKTLKDLSDLYFFLLHEKHGFKTVIIDSITEVNDIIKSEIEKRTGKSMQIQDWGELSKKVLDLLRKFRDLPMNVIFIALEKYITDEDRIKKIVPMIDGKAATGIAAFMDIVGYINVEADGTSWMETNRNKRLLTGDRSGVIGNDAPMDFEDWLKRVQMIETGKQEVTVKYSAKEETSKPVAAKSARPNLKELQLELKERGAADAKAALYILNTAIGTNFDSLDFSEDDASKLLVELLQVPVEKFVENIEKEEPEKIEEGQAEVLAEQEEKVSKNISVYSDIEKVKKMISGLMTVMEVKGLHDEIDSAFSEGDMTESVHSALADLCFKRMQEINDGLLESEKPKKGRKSIK